jgi:alginate O-acetyltransferase complex protein AlgI
MSILSLGWLAILILLPPVYWLGPERLRSPLLAMVTVVILGWLAPISAALLVAATVMAWVGYRYLAANGWAIAAVTAMQAAPLIFYRLAQEEWPVFAGSELIIPLGLSYYALRAIHYTLEAYKRTLPRHDVLDVINYMLFLPTILAGPIHRFPQFIIDQGRRRWNSEMFSEGLERLLYGYLKITLVANLLINSILMGHIATMEADSRAALYLTMIAKGLNGYFQFAGYSDVAIGFARLLGFRVMENFNAPMIRRNIQEFWAAWHISLTSWCRDYVYVPIFSLTRARWLGILGAMAILGLWHEFTARYLAWGLFNGGGIVAWHVWRRVAGSRMEAAIADQPVLRACWTVVSVLLTLHFVFVGFTLVQNDTLAGGLRFLQALFGLS